MIFLVWLAVAAVGACGSVVFLGIAAITLADAVAHYRRHREYARAEGVVVTRSGVTPTPAAATPDTLDRVWFITEQGRQITTWARVPGHRARTLIPVYYQRDSPHRAATLQSGWGRIITDTVAAAVYLGLLVALLSFVATW